MRDWLLPRAARPNTEEERCENCGAICACLSNKLQRDGVLLLSQRCTFKDVARPHCTHTLKLHNRILLTFCQRFLSPRRQCVHPDGERTSSHKNYYNNNNNSTTIVIIIIIIKLRDQFERPLFLLRIL